MVNSQSPIFLLPKSAIFSTFVNSKIGTFGAQHKKTEASFGISEQNWLQNWFRILILTIFEENLNFGHFVNY